MTKTTAVAEQKKAELAVINFEEDANLGHEEISLMDKKIPYINLLQTNSPMVDEDDPDYIDGAKAGSIFITDSKTIINDELLIIPCGYKKHFVEWVPREQGGGLVGLHLPDSPVVKSATLVQDSNKKKFLQTESGNTLVETAQFFVLTKYNDSWNWAVLNMSGTKWSAARDLNTLSTTRKIPGTDKYYPTFAGVYALTTFRDQNKNGDKYHNFKITFKEIINDAEVYKRAKELYSLHRNFNVTPVEDATESETINY